MYEQIIKHKKLNFGEHVTILMEFIIHWVFYELNVAPVHLVIHFSEIR